MSDIKYFRKAGTCRRVISPVAFNYIVLPPESVVALRANQTFESPDQMQAAMHGFEEVDEAIWKDFFFGFYHSVSEERSKVYSTTHSSPPNSSTP